METIFNYSNKPIRTITDENEQTWFAGIDVCKILEYEMPSNVIKDNLDEDERKLTNLTDWSGQKRKTWIINEFGLYSLILTSTKPEAKAFKRWVTHEVLPSIRKAGKFTTEQEQEHEFSLQKMADIIQGLKNDKEYHQKQVNDLRKAIEEKTIEIIALIKMDRSQLRLEFPKDIDLLNN
jgi:anti-repressor protein